MSSQWELELTQFALDTDDLIFIISNYREVPCVFTVFDLNLDFFAVIFPFNVTFVKDDVVGAIRLLSNLFVCALFAVDFSPLSLFPWNGIHVDELLIWDHQEDQLF